VKRPATRGRRVAGVWVVTDLQTLRSFHLNGMNGVESREPSLDCDVEVSVPALPALSEPPRAASVDRDVEVSEPALPRATPLLEPPVERDVEVSEPVVLGCAVAVAAPAIPRPVSAAAAKARTIQGAGRVMVCSFSSGPRTSRMSPDSMSAVIAG
jgi:hypothetical protein